MASNNDSFKKSTDLFPFTKSSNFFLVSFKSLYNLSISA
nr:MAG TPA: hypothetical protein [Bacteriophage sp.]